MTQCAFASALLICIWLLIGRCQAGVDQPQDIPSGEKVTQQTSEVETPVVDGRDPSQTQPSHPRGPGECGSHVVIGMPGPTGPMGPQGFPGVQGPSGFPGNPGNNGNNGQIGSPGRTGTKGERGVPGLAGASGAPGATGYTGPSGRLGLKGDAGLVGLVGAPGKQGVAGAPGSPGADGSSGPKGATGPPGWPGNHGDPGQPGTPGECGCPTPEPSGARPRNPMGGRRRNAAGVAGGWPAFSAARNTGLMAVDGPVIINYQDVFTNVGGHLDEATGVFQCAVPGTYYFSMNIYKSTGDNFPLVQLMLNGDNQIAIIDYGVTDTEDSASNSVILSLAVGDRVYLQLYDGREIHSSHYRFTTFSGFLIAES